MKHRKPSNTLRLTVSAMLAAVGVIVLSVGSLFETLDLSAAAMASFFCIYAVIEIGGSSPWMVWIATSVLGLLLLPQKSPAAFYLILGCYPILKEWLEKKPSRIHLALKALVFAVMLLPVWLVLRLFFPSEVVGHSPWLTVAFFLLGYLTMWIYDYALTKIITFYLIRLRPRLGLKWK